MTEIPRSRLLRLAAAAALFAGALVGLEAVPYRIAIDPIERACLPYSVYLLDLSPEAPPQVGDIVSYRAEGMAPHFPDGTMMAKLVLGVPGDRVRVRRDRVQGQTIAVGGLHAPILEKLGRSASAFERDVLLGPGEYFLVGTAPHSYDSRYVGPVRIDQIVGKDTPLW